MSASAHAANTVYRDKASFDLAAGPTRTIDFSQDDAGNPLSDPPAWIELDFLGLSGICFSEGIGSYNNQYLTHRPATPIKADLPVGTYAFGATLGPWQNVVGTHTVTLSNGETYSIAYEPGVSTWPYFFGVISDTPIDWVTFSFDTTTHLIADFTITASAGQGNRCLPLPAPIAYYPLDGSGTEFTGNNIDLPPVGNPAYVPAMQPGLGQALAADGIDDALVGSGYVPSLTGALTLSAWARAETRADWGSIFKNWGGQFHFGIDGGGFSAPRGALSNYINLSGVGGQPSVAASTLFPVQEWVHTALVVDSSAQTQRLYINGAPVATATFAGSLRDNPCPGLSIGAKPDCSGTGASGNIPGFWHGELDEVAAWDIALTGAQIVELYSLGLKGIPIDARPGSAPPVANAGSDTAVPVGEFLALTGENSTDDLDAASELTYEWTLVSKPDGSISQLQNSSFIKPVFRADLPGEYEIELYVTDSLGLRSSPDRVTLKAGIIPSFDFKRTKSGYRNSYSPGFYCSWSSSESHSNLVDTNNGAAVYLDTQENWTSVFRSNWFRSYCTSSRTFFDQQVTVSDGVTEETLFRLGEEITGGHVVDRIYHLALDSMRLPIFRLHTRVFDEAGRSTSNRALWKYTGSGLQKVFDEPVAYTSADQTVSDSLYVSAAAGDTYVAIARSVPNTRKTYLWEYADGSTRAFHYYDQTIYRLNHSGADPVWTTNDPVPGIFRQPTGVQIRDVSEAGKIALEVSFPSPEQCDGCWARALVLIREDNTVHLVAHTDIDGDFQGARYFNKAAFDGEILTFGVSSAARSQTGIYRFDGVGIVREIDEVVALGRGFSTVTPSPSAYDVRGGNLYFAGNTCEFGIKTNNVVQGVFPCQSGLVDGVRILSSVIPRTHGSAFDSSTLTLQGGYFSICQFGICGNTTYNYNFIGQIDTDRDGVVDRDDNCPYRPNEDQIDTDGNGIGDVCEDTDGDTIPDVEDNCPVKVNLDQLNSDTDIFGDACDLCPLEEDDQSNIDGDTLGDACDPDIDGDLVANEFDNCPLISNASQDDLDDNGVGNACDPDIDGDGIANGVDGVFESDVFDDQSLLSSANFTDQHLGGTSSGRVVSRRAGVFVEDAEDASQGLIVTTTGDARVKECGEKGTTYIIGATTYPVTCGSVGLEVRLGAVVHDVDDTGRIQVELQSGGQTRVVDDDPETTSIIVLPTSSAVAVSIGSSIVATLNPESAVSIEEASQGEYLIANSADSVGEVIVEDGDVTVAYQPGSVGVPVAIDILPGSDRNPINLGAGGSTPVGILSSDSFDATTVDPLSVRLSSAAVRLVGKGTPKYSMEDINGDGRVDLLIHIDTTALDLSNGSTIATLSGAVFSGVDIHGSDVITVVKE